MKFLGAESIDSFDYSGYEGATCEHDFNQPISEDYHARYTVAIDGGTLEHVFNFPVAIANCMRMVEVGGHYLGLTPSNNLMGHGFYQFSPELYFRVLSPENGFSIEKMASPRRESLGVGIAFPTRKMSDVASASTDPLHKCF
ncbi:hypothetical protein [Rubidibacter lacunae]|uniref:hypothetical protein n=1 Tax=Rubidibacter lacunae TaxID=582514 RepID=UPI0006877B96|nr:hypothetical protein [Rubidibacter lacunae]